MKPDKNQARGLAKVSHFFLSGSEPSREKVTLQAAAKMLNVSKGTVVTYLNKGLLTRIKERGCVYIAEDEVRQLADSDRKHLLTRTSSEGENRSSDHEQEGHYSRPHSGLRRYKCIGQDVVVGVLATKIRDIKSLEAEIVSLKQNLAAQASKLQEMKFTLVGLRKKQQRELGGLSKSREAEEQAIEKAQARLRAVEEEVQRLRGLGEKSVVSRRKKWK